MTDRPADKDDEASAPADEASAAADEASAAADEASAAADEASAAADEAAAAAAEASAPAGKQQVKDVGRIHGDASAAADEASAAADEASAAADEASAAADEAPVSTEASLAAGEAPALAEGHVHVSGIRELPLVALRETVIFPEMIVPLQVGRDKSVAALNAAVAASGPIALVTQRQAEREEIEDPSELYNVGTLAKIAQVVQLQDGTVRAIVQGQSRLRVVGFVQTSPYIIVKVEEIADVTPEGIEVQALMRSVQAQIEQYVANGAPVPPEAAVAARNITEPGLLADMVAYSPDLSTEQRMELLATTNVVERLKIVSTFLGRQVEILELKGKIQSEVKSEMDKTQREYILREQLKAIQRELGEDDPQQAEINELREKVEAAGMTEEVKARALKEVDRMSRIPSASPEVGVIRTYVDWLVALPWNVSTTDNLDIKSAAKILDEDHYGLEKIKERILEYLAVRSLAETLRSPILAFVGPPGVGKTSLGKSIARAMGRKFVRMSLGGIHDEAEIRGHRRTYIGALPGRIIQNIKTAGSNNPVFMLDEVDKIGMDFRGDPSSALLEVLDPEQNNTFQDNYLEVPFDLTKVLFITTANLLDPIPPPLRDRMEVVQLPGYTEQEKIEIGKRFLIPKQMKNHGLTDKHIAITDEAMVELVRSYTHEAGVRNLEREIANAMRKVARAVAEGRKRKTIVDVKKLAEYLGPQRFEYGELESEDQIGAATGLVVTEVGGDVIAIEVTLMEGKEDFILTGQLGEVMRESARAGLSWIRAHASQLGIKREVFEKNTLHIHVPAGGIPKDGPSAGITMTLAMVSAFTGIPVRKDAAMTGEITLRGRVLPIGGLKSKILAAHLAGARMIILPKKNEKDLRDIPDEILKQIKLVTVENMEQVLETALRRKPVPLPTEPPKTTADVKDTEPEPEAETPVRPHFPPPVDQPPAMAREATASPAVMEY
jgi:ATP-dependent Lon protease